MKKLLSILGLSVVVVFAGAAMFANASSNNVAEEGLLGVQDQVNDLKVVESKQVAEPTRQVEVRPVAKQSAETTKRTAKLTIEEAVAIAKKHANGQVTEVELERERGKLYYDIEMKDGKYEYEIEIDAQTGEVLDFEEEWDD